MTNAEHGFVQTSVLAHLPGEGPCSSRQVNVENRFRDVKRWLPATILAYLLLLQGLPFTAQAQEAKRQYLLLAAHLGEPYNTSLESLLRETYRLRLVQDGSASPRFKWSFAGGELPSGLDLTPTGVITGKPAEHRAQPYRFQVRVMDTGLPNPEAIEIAFSLTAKASRPRLVSANNPRLVPIGGKGIHANHPTASEISRTLEASAEPGGQGASVQATETESLQRVTSTSHARTTDSGPRVPRERNTGDRFHPNRDARAPSSGAAPGAMCIAG